MTSLNASRLMDGRADDSFLLSPPLGSGTIRTFRGAIPTVPLAILQILLYLGTEVVLFLPLGTHDGRFRSLALLHGASSFVAPCNSLLFYTSVILFPRALGIPWHLHSLPSRYDSWE